MDDGSGEAHDDEPSDAARADPRKDGNRQFKDGDRPPTYGRDRLCSGRLRAYDGHARRRPRLASPGRMAC